MPVFTRHGDPLALSPGLPGTFSPQPRDFPEAKTNWAKDFLDDEPLHKAWPCLSVVLGGFSANYC